MSRNGLLSAKMKFLLTTGTPFWDTPGNVGSQNSLSRTKHEEYSTTSLQAACKLFLLPNQEFQNTELVLFSDVKCHLKANNNYNNSITVTHRTCMSTLGLMI